MPDKRRYRPCGFTFPTMRLARSYKFIYRQSASRTRKNDPVGLSAFSPEHGIRGTY